MQEGAGCLLLLAAAHQTGLLAALTTALPCASPTTPLRLACRRATTVRALLLTLLFLTVVGLKRTWDLRSYTGTMLALLSGRVWVYGYRHVERFLAAVALCGGADRLTDALAQWTAQLWLPPVAEAPLPLRTYYSDGHRKPVYTDERIPRGLIGRTGTIEGCRALVLLHDAQGHPLLATTHRGDQHLTIGLPLLLARYAHATGQAAVDHVVVDREGMGGDFLASLVTAGCTVITILRADHYDGLASFTDIGAFVPLVRDRHGRVVREVAPARFALAIPSRPGETLPLSVALIGDLRCQVRVSASAEADDNPDDPDWLPPPQRWLAGLAPEAQRWWEPEWIATPLPVSPPLPKLIPIVTTAETCEAVTLAHLYTARWPQQENIIRDWLLPLGLDTNHGYAKTAVENSEVAKQRTILEQRFERFQQWAQSARRRYQRASHRVKRRYEQHKAFGELHYKELNIHQRELAAQGLASYEIRQHIRERKAALDAELDEYKEQYWRAMREQEAEWRKIERYCQGQRQLLRQLEDLNAHEQQMYELNNDKDQVMTVCKVALTNLGMWVRDHYFPPSFAQATWKRLEPFFKLPGQVIWEAESVRVTLRPFNDRQLNRDLAVLCARVAVAAPQLPDGRRLLFTIGAKHHLTLDVSPQ
jgi:hypothetical protein